MATKLREDVVLEKVGGIYILVALRSAWGICPFALQISPMAACFWQFLREGINTDTMVSEVATERKMDPNKVQKFYKQFLSALEKYHYTLPGESNS